MNDKNKIWSFAGLGWRKRERGVQWPMVEWNGDVTVRFERDTFAHATTRRALQLQSVSCAFVLTIKSSVVTEWKSIRAGLLFVVVATVFYKNEPVPFLFETERSTWIPVVTCFADMTDCQFVHLFLFSTLKNCSIQCLVCFPIVDILDIFIGYSS